MYCYVHIPFCETKCKYCRFASFSNIQKIEVEKYVHFLCNSITSYTGKKRPLKTLYFWGGTPSTLSSRQLESILKSLKTTFDFSENIEISFEATPQSLTVKNIDTWYSLWINRISSGIQSLNDATLKEIGRTSKEEIFLWLKNLQSSQIQNISVDFIIWLPYVQAWETTEDIQEVLDTFPKIQHVSVYMLEEYYYPENWEHVSLDDEMYLQEYTQAKALLESRGYKRYELSNFAKKWYECQHNQAYWKHKTMVAFGLDAHGYVDGVRYAHENTFKKYYSGKLSYSEKLTDDQKKIEKLMFWLRTSGITKEIVEYLDKEKLEYFIQLWLLKNTKKGIIYQDSATLVLDYILRELLPWNK